MGQLELEALRLGAAILTGGVVALISSLLAFGYAQKVRAVEAAERDDGLRRALLSEIQENLSRLQPPKPEGLDGGVVTPDAPTVDSAWLQARSLKLTDEQRAALGRAYGFASSYNGELVLLNARLSAGGGHLAAGEILIVNNLMFAANRAIKAFEAARDAMKAS